MPIRILVADDHAVFRAGIIALLQNEPDFKVLGESGTGPETLEAARRHDFDVMTLDLTMPDSDPAELARELVRLRPKGALVVLTMHDDPFYVHEMLKAGARGYVVKRSSPARVIEAIRAAAAGDRYVDPALAGAVLSGEGNGAQAGRPASAAPILTPREREICGFLARGHTNVEVGELLGISDRTVETHRNNIMNKLNLKTRAELVRYAMNQGFFSAAF